jgi:hypothetical protein
MFNHFDPTSPLWRELGDPALLRTLPKTYFASVQGASNSRSYYPAKENFKLPKLTPDAPETIAAGESRTYEIFVGDDLRAGGKLKARVALRVASANGAPPRVTWNGTPLAMAAREGHTWSAPIEAVRVSPGLCRVTVTAAGAMRLEDLMVYVE